MILMPLFLLACVGFLGWVRSSTTLAYFQQEEYDNARFLRAWPDLSLIDFKFTTAVILLLNAFRVDAGDAFCASGGGWWCACDRHS